MRAELRWRLLIAPGVVALLYVVFVIALLIFVTIISFESLQAHHIDAGDKLPVSSAPAAQHAE